MVQIADLGNVLVGLGQSVWVGPYFSWAIIVVRSVERIGLDVGWLVVGRRLLVGGVIDESSTHTNLLVWITADGRGGEGEGGREGRREGERWEEGREGRGKSGRGREGKREGGSEG